MYGDRVKHGSMNAIYAAILLRGPVRIAGRRKSRRNWNWNFGGYDEDGGAFQRDGRGVEI